MCIRDRPEGFRRRIPTTAPGGGEDMELSYKLEKFEGPLDLLLHLIEKNKINIYDIPIAEITDQYLEYVSCMEEESLDVVSEFLVMAATLLDIKARMLLPREVSEEGEEEDPRAELVERLLEYKTYKYMSLELKDMEVDADKVFYKAPTIPREVEKYEEPVDLDQLLDGLTLSKLQKIFESVMKRREDKIDPVRSTFGTIKKEPVSLEEKIEAVLEYAETVSYTHLDVYKRQPLRRSAAPWCFWSWSWWAHTGSPMPSLSGELWRQSRSLRSWSWESLPGSVFSGSWKAGAWNVRIPAARSGT